MHSRLRVCATSFRVMMQAYKWLALKLCVGLFVHFFRAEARLTVTPVGSACPGEDMTFTCQKTSNDGAAAALSNVRWTLMRDGVEVIPQLTLTQGSGCPYLYRHYNNLPIMVTLHNLYSTLNVTADNQLHGIVVECLLVSDTAALERESVSIQITQPPSSPSNARINGIRNGSHSATVELAWDANHESNDTNFSISISSNGEPWLSRAAVEDNEASIILTYNTDYTLAVMSANCAGHGEVSSTLDIFLANCSAPVITNPGVIVEPYNSTTEGSVVYLNCDSGFAPSERRMAVCQSNGQWSIKISNFTCEQGTKDQALQTLLMKEEFLFKCEKASGVFLALCKAEAPTFNCSSCDTHDGASGFVHGRLEGLVGITVASFILGMICGLLFLLLPYLIKKRRETINKKKIELSQNMAYETIPFPSRSTFPEKAMIK